MPCLKIIVALHFLWIFPILYIKVFNLRIEMLIFFLMMLYMYMKHSRIMTNFIDFLLYM